MPDLMAGSSGLRSKLRNQRSRVQIPVASRGFCDEQLRSRVMAIYILLYYYQYTLFMYDLCMFIRYLVSITQVLKDT
jgi:hypothetical protein